MLGTDWALPMGAFIIGKVLQKRTYGSVMEMCSICMTFPPQRERVTMIYNPVAGGIHGDHRVSSPAPLYSSTRSSTTEISSSVIPMLSDHGAAVAKLLHDQLDRDPLFPRLITPTRERNLSNLKICPLIHF